MKVKKEFLDDISKITYFKLKPNVKTMLQNEANSLFEMIEKIKDLTIEDQDYFSRITQGQTSQVLREDEIDLSELLKKEEILLNTKNSNKDFFVVPKKEKNV
ncbi:unknown; predicted coding region [Mycoplasmopsis pulmonis]|uniref:Uncharacterized protein n=1 Tax=Mycoplasmopsis pulmonis (strain UAB CTIP) TaxID=272635 RepID=Q98R11_MYCPU|nr:Asp-tRNA(Asn)/Glu-tRNA(Gln) amidotransferase subunit GatC [Mycoplasmopsis pulmonis]MDZ7293165.1 aspartyl/glutamyl-tRNA amidotransferase subunit C [Mycoplasmopsis pulmonis]CAC13372.1 unknown; predicted coding region [Mycoplasmopsis pulmonis]VEU67962.1 aspartyl/glutamyl-tRNA amidotransferase subunit C [Mycoplasmopsis pulmonis]